MRAVAGGTASFAGIAAAAAVLIMLLLLLFVFQYILHTSQPIRQLPLRMKSPATASQPEGGCHASGDCRARSTQPNAIKSRVVIYNQALLTVRQVHSKLICNQCGSATYTSCWAWAASARLVILFGAQ